MRRPLAVALLTVALCAFSAAPAAARSFTASFDDRIQRHDDTSGCATTFCLAKGTTSLGAATLTIDVTSFEPTGRSTAYAASIAVIRLVGDGSTLTLAQDGVVRWPGNSANAPGSLKSFGNPFTYTAAWEVVGGTGRFAGAAGTGTSVFSGAGAVQRATFSGTI